MRVYVFAQVLTRREHPLAVRAHEPLPVSVHRFYVVIQILLGIVCAVAPLKWTSEVTRPHFYYGF